MDRESPCASSAFHDSLLTASAKVIRNLRKLLVRWSKDWTSDRSVPALGIAKPEGSAPAADIGQKQGVVDSEGTLELDVDTIFNEAMFADWDSWFERNGFGL